MAPKLDAHYVDVTNKCCYDMNVVKLLDRLDTLDGLAFPPLGWEFVCDTWIELVEDHFPTCSWQILYYKTDDFRCCTRSR